MSKVTKFKKQLARVFDSDLRTNQWENIVDYVIIGLIIISTLSVFISTFEVSPLCERILNIIDTITVIAFTIEVSLRIWAADELDEKYKGFWGRIKYCFSFYGLIDILSTYTFYIAMVIPLPYSMLKSLRVLRLLRVFRYMRSFRLLQEAISSKAKEMFISLQFLVIVTLMLSFVLFFYEHAAQPEIYNNGFKSVIWAFAQYIGDPGGFADTPPITLAGRIIACIIGLLGIALFAVPAGLLGAGFSEAMDKELHKENTASSIGKLKAAFERKLDRPTGYQTVPPYLSIIDIQARMGMTVDDVFDAVENSDQFRLINLAATQTVDEHPQDKLAVEHYVINRPYGCCIDRGSKVTIVAPSCVVDPGIGYFSYYLAKIGGFNFVSRELGEKRPYRSYYKFEDVNSVPGLAEYMDDVNRLTSREDAWVISMLASSGALEPAYPTQIHFTAGGVKGNEDINAEGLTVTDKARFKALVDDTAAIFNDKFNVGVDFQRYHGIGINGENLYTHKLDNKELNSFALLMAWSLSLWDSRRILVAQQLAELIARHIEGKEGLEPNAELKLKSIGYDENNA